MHDAPTAHLTEVFSSVQGEGPYVGVRQLFVRFYGCHRRCVYCDSPETVTAWQPPRFKPGTYRLEQTPGARDFAERPNPVTVSDMLDLFAAFDRPTRTGAPSGPNHGNRDAAGAELVRPVVQPGKAAGRFAGAELRVHHSVAFTGGEPLLHADFLRALFPRLREAGGKTYLETSGDLYHELEKVLPWLDICAMDIKLPSVTHNEAAWGSHRRFLEHCMAGGVEVFAKIIVSGETAEEDIDRAIAVVADAAPDIPFIVQPMTPFGEAKAPPSAGQLIAWQEKARMRLDDVRVIPQCHKMMGQL